MSRSVDKILLFFRELKRKEFDWDGEAEKEPNTPFTSLATPIGEQKRGTT